LLSRGPIPRRDRARTSTGQIPSDDELNRARRTAFLIARRRGASVHEAEDLAQEVMLRWWRHACRDMVPNTSWILKVLPQCAQAGMRYRTPLAGLTMEPGIEVEPESGPATGDLLASFLERLPRRQQKVLKLHFFDRRTFAEIADIEGITPRAARHTCDRAIESVRNWWAAQNRR
jgi:RNA polymerase sigma factor (sigma-70 family)